MLEKIRLFLKNKKLDAVIIPFENEYLGEYALPETNRLEALTHFTGSAGLAIVSLFQAALFVDSRYTLQAKRQSSFTILDWTEKNVFLWIQKKNIQTIGFDGTCFSVATINNFRQNTQCVWRELKQNPVDLFWENRPPKTKETVYTFPVCFAGETKTAKLQRVREYLLKNKADALCVTALDSVSWLLNKRGNAIKNTPVALKQILIDSEKNIYPFSPAGFQKLAGKTIIYDSESMPFSTFNRFSKSVHFIAAPSVIKQWQAVKNATELSNLKETGLFESAVICRFWCWLEEHKKELTEQQCGAYLQQLRGENSAYVEDSFPSIVAAGAHAALPHYSPNPNEQTPVAGNSVLLVDTGGQYKTGTTDMTRTFAVGAISPLIKKRYTQVLKGHIALASSTIKIGALPKTLDRKAHAFLRADKVDYYHGTGHGIGYFLSVHESPPKISEKSKTPLYPHMVFSNEPAVYDEENGFGIRLENMLYSVLKNGKLHFENLLFIPFDGRLIEPNLLTLAEKEWLNTYHATVKDKIYPLLTVAQIKLLESFIPKF